jgi:hypothetical protein
MRAVVSSALALSLMASSALADGQVNKLAPGKPAGIKKAQFFEDGNGIYILAGVALAGIGIALATTSGNSSGPATSTSISTSTTGTTS